MVIASPSAEKRNWTNSWKKVFTDTKTPSLFQGVPDAKLAGDSSGDLSLCACAHLNLKDLLPFTSVTDFHLPKQNTLFHLHSKQVWQRAQGIMKRRSKLNGVKMGKSQRHWPPFSRSAYHPCRHPGSWRLLPSHAPRRMRRWSRLLGRPVLSIPFPALLIAPGPVRD